MILLAALVALPVMGGLFGLLFNSKLSRAVAACVLAANCVITFYAQGLDATMPWISSLGADIHLRLDGFSFVLVLLANVITLLAVCYAPESHKRREGLFLFLLLATLSGIIGVFIAFDLLLFFLFWEVMLVPLYFLLLLFGEEQRNKAATRFLILTQSSGLVLLISIVALYVLSGGTTFDYFDLLSRPRSEFDLVISLGFLLAFLVKLPALPFHIWMPSVFTNTPVSALMTGILIKTGAYGLIRFYIPLFPDATSELAPYLMILGMIGLIYGSLAAYSQKDIKKILAYSTVAHVGFILAGIFSQNPIAYIGVTVLLVTQAIGTGALMLICNHVYASTHSRELGRFSGLFASMPKTGVFALMFVMAAVGLPGLGNFVGEYYVLVALFDKDWHIAVVATLGIVLSALYMLRFMHGIFFGEQTGVHQASDLSRGSVLVFSILIAIVIFVGFYPSLLIDTVTTWIS